MLQMDFFFFCPWIPIFLSPSLESPTLWFLLTALYLMVWMKEAKRANSL